MKPTTTVVHWRCWNFSEHELKTSISNSKRDVKRGVKMGVKRGVKWSTGGQKHKSTESYWRRDVTEPKEVNEKFQLIVKQRRIDRKEMSERKRRRAELLNPKQIRLSKQSKLRISPAKFEDKYVDKWWSRAFFALDIPINKIGEPLFRQAVETTAKSKTGYVCVRFLN